MLRYRHWYNFGDGFEIADICIGWNLMQGIYIWYQYWYEFKVSVSVRIIIWVDQVLTICFMSGNNFATIISMLNNKCDIFCLVIWPAYDMEVCIIMCIYGVPYRGYKTL